MPRSTQARQDEPPEVSEAKTRVWVVASTKEVATATCKKTGRTVSSDTSAGEESRSSNMWVRLATAPIGSDVHYPDLCRHSA